MTLPLELEAIATSVGRALDPDVGGADSFHRPVLSYDGETPIYADTLVCSSLCTPAFKALALALALAMAAEPRLLYRMCSTDYRRRWADMEPPTLEDCQKFCTAVLVS